jgi:hypothetical protein
MRELHRAEALKEVAEDTRLVGPDEKNRWTPIGRGHALSSLDLGSKLVADDDYRRGDDEQDPATEQPANPQQPPRP